MRLLAFDLAILALQLGTLNMGSVMDLPLIHHASRLVLPRRWHLPFHHHDHGHELVMVVEGAVETEMEERSTIAPAGMVKFHPRGVPHRESAVGGGGGRLLFISWSEGGGADASGLPRLVEDRSGRLRFLLEWIIDLGQRRAPGDADLQRALFAGVLAAHAEAGAVTPPTGGLPMERVQAWIRAHLAQPLALDDLAQQAGMSRFHFARAFRLATGQAPMSFVRDQRVGEARTLLLTSALPLKAIAGKVGFPDEFHLSRVFRRVTGQNPTQVRRLR